MLRKMVTPTKSSITLHLPEEMIGKTIEVIAFEINEDKNVMTRA